MVNACRDACPQAKRPAVAAVAVNALRNVRSQAERPAVAAKATVSLGSPQGLYARVRSAFDECVHVPLFPSLLRAW